MKCATILKVLATGLISAFASFHCIAEDIDIFVGSSAGAAQNPKILIILENDANWSRASQKWPGGVVQGQSEASAIKTLINGSTANVNLGLMEYATAGNGNSGGFIRKAIAPLDASNKTIFATSMDTIYNNINSSTEKVSSSFGYGDLMYSAFNYFSGASTVAPSSSVVSSIADSNGYTANYTTFASPLSDANSCGRNFVIFIANNAQGTVPSDTTANGAALVSLGGSISPQLPYQNYTTTTSTTNTNLGYTSQCYSALSSCATSDYTTQCSSGSYDSCSCSASNTTTSLDACMSGTSRFAVYGNTNSGGTTTTVGPTAGTPVTTAGGVSSCYSSGTTASAAVTSGADQGGMSCPGGTTTTVGGVTTITSYSCSYALVSSSPSLTATQNCPGTAGSPVLSSPASSSSSAVTTTCYKSLNSGNGNWQASGDNAGLTCPATTVVTSGNQTVTTTYTCTYSGVLDASCGQSTNKVKVTQTAFPSASTVTTSPNYKYDVKQTATPSVTTTTKLGVTTTTTFLGNTTACYASATDAAFSTQFSSACSSYNGGCTGGTATATAGLCTSGARYMVVGTVSSSVSTPTGSTYIPTDGAYADEWARFMHQAKAINRQSGTDQIKQAITTYTIDVFNAQQNTSVSALLQSMARAGGGKYFVANNEAQILAALRKILAEIQSINTGFASATLPISASNRSDFANQVYIGSFRPDPDANPRWFGNLKRYSIGYVNGSLALVDVNGNTTENTQTGFIDDCAVAYWTTDSGSYWANLLSPINPDPASRCGTIAAGTAYSDLPDGPQVEKGGAAEVLRKGNNAAAATATYVFNRNILTYSGGSLATFSAATSGLSDQAVNNVVGFAQGKDINNDTGSGGPSTSVTRPSIHGDLVHSRPLAVNYGTAGTDAITVFYGSNDGLLHALNGSTGEERWAFIAPEFFPKLQRLKDNTPLISYPSIVSLGLTSAPKDYFFDGSFGIYQKKDNSKVWIYPTQRRGGRMVYGFDVTNPSNPVLKWRHGCPDLADDTGCTTGGSSYADIGQTWSVPSLAFIKGFSSTTPVLVMGGGYDNCEDLDSAIKFCGSAKGRLIYLINADTGDIIRTFSTDRSVIADIAFIDVNNDGLADYVYAADTGGSIYRIDLVDGPVTAVPLTSANWTMRKIAYTNSGGRRFQYAPAIFQNGTNAFLAIVSGDRERPLITNYPYTTPIVNRVYVYKDDLTLPASTAAVNLDGSTMINFTEPSSTTCGSDTFLSASNASKNGWYRDLNAGRGEQGVTSPVIVGGTIYFSTNRPIVQTQSCGSVLGEARGYALGLFNGSGIIGTTNGICGGTASGVFAGGGLPPTPIVGTVLVGDKPVTVVIGAIRLDGGATSDFSVQPPVIPISQIRTRTYKSIKGDN